MHSRHLIMVFLSISACFIARQAVGASWMPVGSGSLNMNPNYRADWPSMAMAADGTVYVSWTEYYYFESAKVFVKHWDGYGWVEQGSGCLNVSPTRDAYCPRIAIVNNLPYVAWQESDAIRVKHWNGTGWVQESGSLNMDANKSAHHPDIAADGDTPYVAWSEFDGVVNQVYVKYWNGDQWVQAGTGSLNLDPSKNAYDVSLVVMNRIPYVAWTEGDTPQVYVKHWNGNAWVQDGASSINTASGNYAATPCLTVAGGTLWISWMEGDGAALRAHVKRWNGSDWILQDVGAPDNNDIIGCSLASSGEIPYLVWLAPSPSGGQGIFVKHWNGSAWVQDGESSINANGMTASKANIAIRQGEPWVVWSETDNQQDSYKVYVKSFRALTPNESLPGFHPLVAYPNPAKHAITFSVVLPPRPSTVTIDIFNLNGERVARVSGTGSLLAWDCRSAAPGVYLGLAKADGKEIGKAKVVIAR